MLQAEACNTAKVRSIYDSQFFVVDSYRLYEVFRLSPLQESLGMPTCAEKQLILERSS